VLRDNRQTITPYDMREYRIDLEQKFTITARVKYVLWNIRSRLAPRKGQVVSARISILIVCSVSTMYTKPNRTSQHHEHPLFHSYSLYSMLIIQILAAVNSGRDQSIPTAPVFAAAELT